MSNRQLFMTFIDDGGHTVGRYVLDNLDEAKNTVEEYLNMKYAVDVGEWEEDDWGDRHILQTSPDNFNAGVAPLSLHSTADEALGPMRESWEDEKKLAADGGQREGEVTLSELNHSGYQALREAVMNVSHDISMSTDVTVKRLDSDSVSALLKALQQEESELSAAGLHSEAKHVDKVHRVLANAAMKGGVYGDS